MNKQQKQVAEFMRMAGQSMPWSPCSLTIGEAANRCDMLLEECHEEYLAANSECNVVEIADALGDALYVLLGTANSHGIDLEPIFEEIHRSNMTKLWYHAELDKQQDPTETITCLCSPVSATERVYRVVNRSGKLVKSPSYSPANLTPILEVQLKGKQ